MSTWGRLLYYYQIELQESGNILRQICAWVDGRGQRRGSFRSTGSVAYLGT